MLENNWVMPYAIPRDPPEGSCINTASVFLQSSYRVLGYASVSSIMPQYAPKCARANPIMLHMLSHVMITQRAKPARVPLRPLSMVGELLNRTALGEFVSQLS